MSAFLHKRRGVAGGPLETLAWLADFHRQYLGDAVVHFRREASGVQTVFALDTDLIYSYIFPYRCDAVNAVLASSVIDSLKQPCVIPPGTASELFEKLSDCFGNARSLLDKGAIERASKGHEQDLDRLRDLSVSMLRMDSDAKPSDIQSIDDVMKAVLKAVAGFHTTATRLRRFLNKVSFLSVAELFDNITIFENAWRQVPLATFTGRLGAIAYRKSLDRSNRADALNLSLIAAHRAWQGQVYYDSRREYRPRYHVRLATATHAIAQDASILRDWDHDFWAKDVLRILPQVKRDANHAKLIADVVELKYITALQRCHGPDPAVCADRAEETMERCTTVEGMLLHRDRQARRDQGIFAAPRPAALIDKLDRVAKESIGPIASYVDEIRNYVFDPVLNDVHEYLASDISQMLTSFESRPREGVMELLTFADARGSPLMIDAKGEIAQLCGLLNERLKSKIETSRIADSIELTETVLSVTVRDVVRRDDEDRFEVLDTTSQNLVLGVAERPVTRTLYWRTACSGQMLVEELQDMLDDSGLLAPADSVLSIELKWEGVWRERALSREASLVRAYAELVAEAGKSNCVPTSCRIVTDSADIWHELSGANAFSLGMIYCVCARDSDIAGVFRLYTQTAYDWRSTDLLHGAILNRLRKGVEGS